MSILDEYCRNARECQRMADKARNPIDKALWLRLAASWLEMLKNKPDGSSAGKSDQDIWPTPSEKDSQASH